MSRMLIALTLAATILAGCQGKTRSRLPVGEPGQSYALEVTRLVGFWVGDYRSHGEELIQVRREPDGRVLAIKVTGDRNVPAGKPTFEIDANGNAMGLIADVGFENPRYVPGRLVAHNPDFVEFEWIGIGRVSFRRVSADDAESFLVAHGIRPKEVDRKEAIARALAQTVMVRTPEGSGSGFIVRDGLVVTNLHVVEGQSEIVVRLSSGKTAAVQDVRGFDTLNGWGSASEPAA